MSDFFERYNSSNTSPPRYRRNSEVPLFIFMMLKNIMPFTTSVNRTVRVQCQIDPRQAEIFFFLNNYDYQRMNSNDVNFLTSEIENGRNPFVFMAKTERMLRTVIVGFSEEAKTLFQQRRLVRLKDIPQGIRDEMNFAELANNGFRFE